MNLQHVHLQADNLRPSVDSRQFQNNDARISKISKVQDGGEQHVSQMISHRSLLNHAKQLFGEEQFVEKEVKKERDKIISESEESGREHRGREESGQ